MKRKLYHLVLAVVALSACGDDSAEPPHGEVVRTIELNARTEGRGDSAENSVGAAGDIARLLFWTEAEFHNQWMEESTTVRPDAEAVLPEAIDNYNYDGGRVFSTGVRYLGANAPYHVTGYAPDYALSPVSERNYSELRVGENWRDGKTDFLSCDGSAEHMGWTDSPFTLKEHELKFRHLTACISFKARRSERMLNKVAVNNVTVTVAGSNGLEIPIAFKRHVQQGTTEETDDRSTYLISVSVPQLGGIEIPSPDKNYIRQDEQKEIGACYVVHGMEKVGDKFVYDPFEKLTETSAVKPLTITVTADYSLIVVNEVGELEYQFLRRAEWKDQVVKIATKTGDMFFPGYCYEVLITFDSDELLLEGRNIDWEDGGEHYLPVYPPGTDDEQRQRIE